MTSSYKSRTMVTARDLDANEDIFSDLRSPTNFGQPDWDVILKAVQKLDSPSKLGVFPCNSLELVCDLRIACMRCSQRDSKLKLSMMTL